MVVALGVPPLVDLVTTAETTCLVAKEQARESLVTWIEQDR
jgi:hypothetical protein